MRRTATDASLLARKPPCASTACRCHGGTAGGRKSGTPARYRQRAYFSAIGLENEASPRTISAQAHHILTLATSEM